MSNLIKYPFVNLQGKETRVIQYESEEKKFVPLDNKKKVVMKSLKEVEEEKEARQFEAQEETAAAEFAAGVPVTNFDDIIQQKTEEAAQEAENIVSRAREDAEGLLADARQQMDEMREQARQEGISLGREEGIRQGQAEVDQMRRDLETERQQQKQEYDEMIQQTEGQYVEILCSLIRKITGVIVSDKRDVILHLIRSGIADMEPAKRYTIRACTEDLLCIESNKEDIVKKTGITGVLEVQEEKGLPRGECVIETDTQMIDCGFQTQLENLISTLRILAQQ